MVAAVEESASVGRVPLHVPVLVESGAWESLALILILLELLTRLSAAACAPLFWVLAAVAPWLTHAELHHRHCSAPFAERVPDLAPDCVQYVDASAQGPDDLHQVL